VHNNQIYALITHIFSLSLSRFLRQVIPTKKGHLNNKSATLTRHGSSHEIELLSKISCVHIASFYESRESEYGDFLLMEFVSGGDLRHIIHPPGVFSIISISYDYHCTIVMNVCVCLTLSLSVTILLFVL
jgi:serine/threonine protein kinase